MGRGEGDGRPRALEAVRPLLVRLAGLLGPDQPNGRRAAYEFWEDAEYAYLEVGLPGPASGGIDLSVSGDRVLIRVSNDPSP